MKTFKVILIFLTLILVLLSRQASADEVFGAFGLGVFNSAKSEPAEVRDLYIGLRKELPQGTFFEGKVGFWGDSAGNGRTSSAFVAAGPGLSVDLRPVVIRAGVNLAAISSPDAYLGGVFQFNETLFLGVKDPTGNSIGFVFDHFSSAGIESPNVGRDTISIQIGQSF